jgi:hypothetical protein
MPRRKKRTRQTNQSRQNSLLVGPAVGKMEYTGPIRLPREMRDTEMWTVTLTNFTTLSSTVGGVIANVFTSDPSLSTDFADLTLVWAQYRCLGFEIQALPLNQYSKTTTVCVPGVGVLDRNNATALASLNGSEGYESSRRLSLENPWTMVLKMSNIDEGSFLPLGGPVAFSWIKLYFTGLTVSTDYMQIVQRWRLQLRNRR